MTIKEFLENIENLKHSNIIEDDFEITLYNVSSDTFYPLASVILNTTNKEVRLGPLFEENPILT